jgi:hypothetical protein
MQFTYTTLLESCQQYCIDTSNEYESEFPNIVQIAETRIIKDLNLQQFSTSVTSTMTSGSGSVSKPDGLIVIQDFFIIINNQRRYLQQRSKSYLNLYWNSTTSVGTPVYFCEDTTTSWLVGPIPDQGYQYQVNFVTRPTPMSSTNITTWIGDNLGECLHYATLIESMGFFREDVVTEQGITQFWERNYQNGIQQALNELMPMIEARNNQLKKITTITGG